MNFLSPRYEAVLMSFAVLLLSSLFFDFDSVGKVYQLMEWYRADETAERTTVRHDDKGDGINGEKKKDRTPNHTNFLFVVCDQLRYDALRFVQDSMPDYDDKVKIRTPNIDRLAASGVSFNTTYCGSAICGPSRVMMKTGASMQRTGVLHNQLGLQLAIHRERIDNLDSYEQILAERMNYTVESYGKWHAPFGLFYERNSSKLAVRSTYYDHENETFAFEPTVDFYSTYRKQIDFLIERDGYNRSERVFEPFRLDFRYRPPNNTNYAPPEWKKGQDFQAGVSEWPPRYSLTGMCGDMAIRALDRLSTDDDVPFLLSIHFDAPHPGFVVSQEYMDYYWKHRDQLYIPPSISDDMGNSAYLKSALRNHHGKEGYLHNDKSAMAEVTAAYYGMVEEVDEWVGKMLDKLRDSGLSESTLVVFTSDHGELLGAHGLGGKVVHLEESVRVPLILSMPTNVPTGEVVSDPVSHIDLHATFLDYAGASAHDRSDGQSLRRFIENTAYNEKYDDGAVISELDLRLPKSTSEFNRPPGMLPSFMIRKGHWKLLLPKLRSSRILDMMYDLSKDPYEMHNYLGYNSDDASDEVIAKSEHLKSLLVEWMKRNDGGDKRYYSDNRYNLGDGEGDIAEIQARRTWRGLDYWQSDSRLTFGKPAFVNGQYRRNEYLYIGRTNPGSTTVSRMVVSGTHASLFSLKVDGVDMDRTPLFVIQQDAHLRIQVAFASPHSPPASLDARIEIYNTVHNTTTILIAREL